jgi:hypothetical protein
MDRTESLFVDGSTSDRVRSDAIQSVLDELDKGLI